MTEEKRRGLRKHVSLEARWEGLSGKHLARVADISAGGCFIDTQGQAETGEQISFEVRLPSGLWLSLHGRVIAYDPNVGFSLRFVSLTEDDRQALQQLFPNSS